LIELHRNLFYSKKNHYAIHWNDRGIFISFDVDWSGSVHDARVFRISSFYKDYSYSKGLIVLGKIDTGIEALKVSGSVQVKIELN